MRKIKMGINLIDDEDDIEQMVLDGLPYDQPTVGDVWAHIDPNDSSFIKGYIFDGKRWLDVGDVLSNDWSPDYWLDGHEEQDTDTPEKAYDRAMKGLG